MTRPTFQLTLINDTSEGFFVEWLDADGRSHGQRFPVRDAAQPDQHTYAVNCVEGFLRDNAPVHDRAGEMPNPEPGEQPPKA